DRVAQDLVVARQRRLHLLGVLLPEARRTLEIGEQERDRPRGQPPSPRHRASLAPPVGPPTRARAVRDSRSRSQPRPVLPVRGCGPMDVLRTPDDRFTGLPDYDFAPHYTDIADGDGGQLRVHHVDEGPSDAPTVVLMHGEPSWCFLYRKMIPVLVDAGLRAVAPDLVGFGRSDKPSKRTDYTYQRHVDWMTAWLEAND